MKHFTLCTLAGSFNRIISGTTVVHRVEGGTSVRFGQTRSSPATPALPCQRKSLYTTYYVGPSTYYVGLSTFDVGPSTHYVGPSTHASRQGSKWVWGSGCRCWNFGFRGLRLWGSRFEFEGLGLRVQGLGFRVQGSGCRVQGSGFEVWSPGARV